MLNETLITIFSYTNLFQIKSWGVYLSAVSLRITGARITSVAIHRDRQITTPSRNASAHGRQHVPESTAARARPSHPENRAFYIYHTTCCHSFPSWRSYMYN